MSSARSKRKYQYQPEWLNAGQARLAAIEEHKRQDRSQRDCPELERDQDRLRLGRLRDALPQDTQSARSRAGSALANEIALMGIEMARKHEQYLVGANAKRAQLIEEVKYCTTFATDPKTGKLLTSGREVNELRRVQRQLNYHTDEMRRKQATFDEGPEGVVTRAHDQLRADALPEFDGRRRRLHRAKVQEVDRVTDELLRGVIRFGGYPRSDDDGTTHMMLREPAATATGRTQHYTEDGRLFARLHPGGLVEEFAGEEQILQREWPDGHATSYAHGGAAFTRFVDGAVICYDTEAFRDFGERRVVRLVTDDGLMWAGNEDGLTPIMTVHGAQLRVQE